MEDIKLTQTEIDAVLKRRLEEKRALMSIEEKEKESGQADGLKSLTQGADQAHQSYRKITHAFLNIKNSGHSCADKFTLVDFKVKIEMASYYQKHFDKGVPTKEADARKIVFKHTEPNGTEFTDTIGISIDGPTGKKSYRYSCPTNYHTSTRYSPQVVLKTFLKHIGEAITRKQTLFNSANARIVQLDEWLLGFKVGKPIGTTYTFQKERIYSRFRQNNRSSWIEEQLHVDFPNGNKVKLRMRGDCSFDLISKVDVTTKDFKPNDWVEYLMKG